MTTQEAAALLAPPEPKDPRTLILEFVLWASKHKHFPLMRGDLKDNTAVPVTLAAAVHLITEFYDQTLAPGALDAIQNLKYPKPSDWEQFVRDNPAPPADAE